MTRLALRRWSNSWWLSGPTGLSIRLASTKKQALRVLSHVMNSGVGSLIEATVRVRSADGRIAEERTYPRRSDPKRRRG